MFSYFAPNLNLGPIGFTLFSLTVQFSESDSDLFQSLPCYVNAVKKTEKARVTNRNRRYGGKYRTKWVNPGIKKLNFKKKHRTQLTKKEILKTLL